MCKEHIFPLDVLMVPSSVLGVSTDGECLMCGGFSLDETIQLHCFEFIADYFGGLSLSPTRNDLGALHGLNPQRVTVPATSHDRGLHRGVPYDIKRGGGLQPLLSQKAQHGGLRLLLSQPHHG
jgi:hypothetical protein